MCYPTLNTLPPSPVSKTDWPWTDESPQLPKTMPNGSQWPRITIVTPSYNQGQYLEETIRSVLLQGYPNLEYIIIDGGSTDKSVEIIKKYEPWLTYWQSKKDNGQSDAINQGFALSTGKIMGWVNSDDILAKQALYHLALYYQPGLNWWNGTASQIMQDGTIILRDPQQISHVTRNDLLHARKIITQISTFWTREIWNQVGSYVSDRNLVMDYELWLRFSQLTNCLIIPERLGFFRTHFQAKTGTVEGFKRYLSECDRLRLQEYIKERQPFIIRAILINFWTRFSYSKIYGWKTWLMKIPIPYV